MPQNPKLLLIDAHALLYRVYHALPPLTTPRGEPIGAVFGFVSVLLKVLKELRPDYLVAAFDREEPTFRHERFKEYKATRPPTPDELSAQFSRVKQVLDAWGITYFEEIGLEADDVIATIVKRFKGEPIDIYILSGDLDTLQLVSERVKVITPKKGPSETVVYDITQVKKRFEGLKPSQMTDYKALVGDPSDNIPGVPGIGPKTAIKLLLEFETVENIIKAALKRDPKLPEKMREKIEKFSEQAVFSKELTRLNYNARLELRLEELCLPDHPPGELIRLFQDLGFYTLVNRFSVTERTPHHPLEVAVREPQIKLVSSEDFFSKRILQLGIAYDKDSKQLYFIHEEEAIAVSLPLSDEATKVIHNDKIAKFGHDLKSIMHLIYPVLLQGPLFDTMVASWLLRPGERDYSFERILFIFLGIDPGKSFLFKASHLKMLVSTLEEKLKEERLERIFSELEMPLVPILFVMEKKGVLVDKARIQALQERVTDGLRDREQQIFQLAGQPFNLNSPREMGRVLFGELGLGKEQKVKKTPKGVLSTKASELEKLKEAHPIVEEILKWRELFKLKSTYLDVLPSLIDPRDGRIHTTYNQTGTITGRLSSSQPNLQNIPLHTSIAKDLRSIFVAPPGRKLVSFDYSQVHLRIIASLANDQKMIEAFKKGLDIHKFTAAQVNNVSIKDVTPSQRDAAKALNFGIIYGMGVQAFSETAGISRSEAKAFIDKYFRDFASIANFLKETKEQVGRDGFAETPFGRRRAFPEITSTNPMLRAQAERMAVNFPIQGLEADIMKKAMIEVDASLRRQRREDICMILQVHDQLVFEMPENEKSIIPSIQSIMEKALKLAVPLVVEVKEGKNWGEL